jgi:hypothetical protein
MEKYGDLPVAADLDHDAIKGVEFRRKAWEADHEDSFIMLDCDVEVDDV